MNAQQWPVDEESKKRRADFLGQITKWVQLVVAGPAADKIINECYMRRDTFIRDPSRWLENMPWRGEQEKLQAKQELLGKSKRIGQVGLWNSHERTMQTPLFDRPRAIPGPITHAVSSVRHQVVLYDVENVKGIYPVSDEAFWTPPLLRDNLQELISQVKDRFSSAGRKALQFGYKFSDTAYVRQLCLHGVGGLQVDFFSFETNPHVASVVDLTCDPAPEEDDEDGKRENQQRVRHEEGGGELSPEGKGKEKV
jgi:hypothetical protein